MNMLWENFGNIDLISPCISFEKYREYTSCTQHISFEKNGFTDNLPAHFVKYSPDSKSKTSLVDPPGVEFAGYPEKLFLGQN